MIADTKLMQKALLVNGLLIVYFCCTNLSSFLGIIIGFALLAFTRPYGFLSQQIESFSNIQMNHLSINSIHKYYNIFLSEPLGKQIVKLLGLYILTKICWYVPTWLLVVVVGEVYVFWNLLTENQVFQIAGSYARLTKQSIQKFVNLVPKYQAKQ